MFSTPVPPLGDVAFVVMAASSVGFPPPTPTREGECQNRALALRGVKGQAGLAQGGTTPDLSFPTTDGPFFFSAQWRQEGKPAC